MQKKPPKPPAWWPFPVSDPDTLKILIAADKARKKEKRTLPYPPALL